MILPLLLVAFHGNSASEITPLSVKMSSVWTGTYYGIYTSLPGDLCIDNNKETFCHTKRGRRGESFPWVAVEIPRSRVQQVIITNRVDCCGSRTRGMSVFVGDTLPTTAYSLYRQGRRLGYFSGRATEGQVIPFDNPQGFKGKYVIVQKGSRGDRSPINLAEIDIFGEPSNTDSCYCGLAQRIRRIVGGTETEVNEYPWQAALMELDQTILRFKCGGNVISDQWVLTAAHCTSDKLRKDLRVLLGEHDITDEEATTLEMDIAHIIIHPNYDKNVDLDYDVSLLKLTRRIDFTANSHIRPICLPSEFSTKDYDGYIATATGWGAVTGTHDADKLQEVNLRVISNTKCSTKYSLLQSPLFPRVWQITNSMICAEAEDGNGGKDTCNGDSGGPLVTKEPGSSGEVAGENYELIGVVSRGVVCGSKYFPGVYARVTEITTWIRETISLFGTFDTCLRG